MQNFFSTLATHRTRLDIFFEKKWLILPLLSAFLVILSFYPFRVPFLVFVAFVPFFYFLNFSATLSSRKVFWGGAMGGALISFSLSYATIMQFHWIPEAYLFTYIVRLLFIPIALISGAVSGIFLIFYRFLRTPSIYLNLLLMGSAVIMEVALSWIFGGYYFFAVPSTVVDNSLFMGLGSAGGVFLVSFAVYLVNAFLASFLLARTRTDMKKVCVAAFAFFALLIIVSSGILTKEKRDGFGEIKPLKIALIQDLDKKEGAFGKMEENGS